MGLDLVNQVLIVANREWTGVITTANGHITLDGEMSPAGPTE